MSWQPKVTERNPEFHRQKYLPKGEAILKQILTKRGLEWERFGEIGDDEGKYAYMGVIKGTIRRFVLLAREKPYGNLVGAGLDILQLCSRERIPLLIYVDSSLSVYQFNPDVVKEKATISFRYGKTYYDFPLSLGKNFEKLIAEQMWK